MSGFAVSNLLRGSRAGVETHTRSYKRNEGAYRILILFIQALTPPQNTFKMRQPTDSAAPVNSSGCHLADTTYHWVIVRSILLKPAGSNQRLSNQIWPLTAGGSQLAPIR